MKCSDVERWGIGKASVECPRGCCPAATLASGCFDDAQRAGLLTMEGTPPDALLAKPLWLVDATSVASLVPSTESQRCPITQALVGHQDTYEQARLFNPVPSFCSGGPGMTSARLSAVSSVPPPSEPAYVLMIRKGSMCPTRECVRSFRKTQPNGGTAMNTPAPLPVWALQRVASVLEMESQNLALRINAVDLARRTGLSKSLARRCLRQLEERTIPSER
jgi:hypothetical protein